eukprot:SAG11_NODE_275_length_11309_cov_6.090901_10_plen_56_part_00
MFESKFKFEHFLAGTFKPFGHCHCRIRTAKECEKRKSGVLRPTHEVVDQIFEVGL